MTAKRYRKKPVEIEAFHWTRGTATAPHVIEWILNGSGRAKYWNAAEGDPEHISIGTLEGSMRADVGDYIICGVKGEFYPCKPDIFAATYDEVTT